MIFEHTEAFRIKFMSTSKSWIQVLKNHLIRNASLCSSIISKNLYWSEFGFLVSFWLNFHFFIFFRFQIFLEWAGPGSAHKFLEISKFSRKWADPGPAHSEKSWNFWRWKKKFFLEKNFFLRVLWTSKLFWWKVWILYYIWLANLSGKACIPISVAAFFSRFR